MFWAGEAAVHYLLWKCVRACVRVRVVQARVWIYCLYLLRRSWWEEAAFWSSTPISTCQRRGLSQLFTEKWMSFKCQSHSSGLLGLSHMSGPLINRLHESRAAAYFNVLALCGHATVCLCLPPVLASQRAVWRHSDCLLTCCWEFRLGFSFKGIQHLTTAIVVLFKSIL